MDRYLDADLLIRTPNQLGSQVGRHFWQFERRGQMRRAEGHDKEFGSCNRRPFPFCGLMSDDAVLYEDTFTVEGGTFPDVFKVEDRPRIASSGPLPPLLPSFSTPPLRPVAY